jgi:hypothetical protein
VADCDGRLAQLVERLLYTQEVTGSSPVPPTALETVRLEELVRQVVEDVDSRRPPNGMRTKIIGVDGAGGSGKSTFAEHLASALGSAQIVHTDDFASWDNPIDWWPALVRDVLEPISRSRTARFTPTIWNPAEPPSPVEVAPASHLIVEGVTATREAFRPYLTYSIWIETRRDVRLNRGLLRDGEDARAQWEQWMAEEDAYMQRERPDERADLVVDGGRDLWR